VRHAFRQFQYPSVPLSVLHDLHVKTAEPTARLVLAAAAAVGKTNRRHHPAPPGPGSAAPQQPTRPEPARPSDPDAVAGARGVRTQAAPRDTQDPQGRRCGSIPQGQTGWGAWGSNPEPAD
jgi:hypothetical protein